MSTGSAAPRDGGEFDHSRLLMAVDSYERPGASGPPRSGSGNVVPRPASRRSSKRSMHCDDDMSDSDDDKPLAPLVMRAATAPSALALPRTLATANPGAVSKSPLAAADRHQSSKENLAPPKRKAVSPNGQPKKHAASEPRADSPRRRPRAGQPLDTAPAEVTSATPTTAQCRVEFGFGPPRSSLSVDQIMTHDFSGPLPTASPIGKPMLRAQGTPEETVAQIPRVAAKPTPHVVEQHPDANISDKLSLPVRIAECKARISDLENQKAAVLEQQDYIAAHHLKEQIQKQKQLLETLTRQLDSMPTPARRASMAAAKVAVGSGRSGKSPAKGRSACSGGGRKPAVPLDPNAGAFSRPAGLTAALNRMAAANGTAPIVSPQPPQESRHDTDAGNKLRTTSAADSTANDSPDAKAKDSPDSKDFRSCSEGAEAASEESEEAGNDDEEAEMTGPWRAAARPGHVELTRESDAKASELVFMVPRDTFNKLYPYQRAGVAWMARLWQANMGGILADEMGLGKTVQVCAFLNGARKAGATHALLLLPVTLLDQWGREARKWCPGWPVHVYYGSPNERKRALRRLQRPQGGILLTSYQTLSNCQELFQVPVCDQPSPRRNKKRKIIKEDGKRRKLGDDDEREDFSDSDDDEPGEPETPGGGLPELGTTKAWDIVVCDEAHRIKNISSLLGKSIRGLRSNCRILLTGTPVQNALQDLWALVDFAQPGVLGNHATFTKQFSDPIARGSFGGASTFQVELKKHLAEQLRQIIMPHLLRRTKQNAGLMAEEGGDDEEMGMAEVVEDGAQAAKLPPKRETIVWLAPSTEQLDAYKKVLESSNVIREACEAQKLGFEVFRAIGLLKRLCNHPALLLKMEEKGAWSSYLSEATAQLQDAVSAELKEDTSVDAVADETVTLSDSTPESLGQDGKPDDAEAGTTIEEAVEALGRSAEDILSYSSKLRCLNSLLPALAKRGHRTLVFCQSVKMLDLVQICCLKPNKLRCLRIDGQCPAQERHEKVNKFNKQRDRFQCMLLTSNVGGVGLNLTSADRVILVDPAWNPAIDAQAVDRAFRIGQDKEVKVYRLIVSGLIEDKMFRLQVFKMGQAKTALESGPQQRYFSQREIRALFDWTDPAEGETRQMLLQKHGDSADDITRKAAAEDGANDAENGWLGAGPAVGLSDFANLYSSFGQDEEPDEECLVQVEEAKEKLGAADEKLQQKSQVRMKAEKQQEKHAKDLEETNKALENMKERRMRVVETVKERNGEVVQERRAESAAQTRLQKASREHTSAEEKYHNSKQASLQADAALASMDKLVDDTLGKLSSMELVFAEAHAEAKAQLNLVQSDGSALANGFVEVSGKRPMLALQKAFEKLQEKLDILGQRQVELDFSEKELLKADMGLAQAETAIEKIGGVFEGAKTRPEDLNAKKYEREVSKCEVAQKKAKDKADGAREGTVIALQSCVEAGVAFVESLQKDQDKPVKMDQVRSIQQQAKTFFKQFSQSFSTLRKMRESSAKILSTQRSALQKTATAQAVLARHEWTLKEVQLEHQKAVASENEVRASRAVKEQALAKSEAARARAEAEEAELKKQRDELKAGREGVKEALKAARNAEKEASHERQDLHKASSKVERQHLEMEEAKGSAVRLLKGEEYDSTQVQKAYEAQNG